MRLASMISNSVDVKVCSNYAEAQAMAVEEASATGGQPFPAILFRQGTRAFASTALPIGVLRQRVHVREVKKGDDPTAVLTAANRPVMQDHARSIARFIESNLRKKYVLPPITLNVHQEIRVYVPNYPSDIIASIIVIPRTAKISVTDGGHRHTALVKLAKELSADDLSELDSQSISVMLSFETDALQSHQDFADTSRTKPLPPSLIAAYDLRNPANGLVIDLIEECPLFKNKIDSTSKTLSKKSPRLFLTNHIRQFVKTALFGDPSMADDMFIKKSIDLLEERNSESYLRQKLRLVEFVNIVTSNVPVLHHIANSTDSMEINRIVPESREKGYVCLTATGLLIMARVFYEVFTKPKLHGEAVEIARRLGADIDWRKQGELWQDTIVVSGKSFSNKGPLNKATEAVKRKIGIAAMDSDVLAENVLD